MKELLIQILLITVLCSCHEGSHVDELPDPAPNTDCQTQLSMEINDELLHFSLDQSSRHPLTIISINDSLENVMIPNFLVDINDPRRRVWVTFHYKMTLSQLSESLDSVLFSNIATGKADFLPGTFNQAFTSDFETHTFGVTIQYTDSSRMNWNSYTTSKDKKVGEEPSLLIIREQCSSRIYRGVFSCTLYDKNGNSIDIRDASFTLKLK